MKNEEHESVKNEFIELLGENKVDRLIENNWIGFGIKRVLIKRKLTNSDIIEMDFFYKDMKGDKVVYSTICYSKHIQKWWSQNFDEYDEIMFANFSDLENSLIEREAEYASDGSPIITF